MSKPMQLPDVGAPIDIAWECPSWCTVNHETDGYTRHGHIIHRATQTLAADRDAEFWHVEIGTWSSAATEVVEFHLPLSCPTFKSGVALRAHATELLAIADQLDVMNAEVSA